MAKALIVAGVLFALLALAAGQPCIECKDCQGNSGCLSKCQRECPRPPVTVNVNDCKRYGENAGKDAANTACDLTLKYCQANKIEPRTFRPPMVTLQQCGNAAYGTCQAWTRDRFKSPCGRSFNGIAACSGKDFQDFYNSVADSECNQKASVFDKPQGRK